MKRILQVRIGSVVCDEFSVKVEVHQGSVSSPILFTIVMDEWCVHEILM